MSVLEFREVTVRFGRGATQTNAVRAVNLVVPSGAVVGLVGESGSGKSTLARAAVGLLPIASGQILLDGESPLSGARRRVPPPVQMVFQDANSSLDPRLTVQRSIAEAMPGIRDRGRRQHRILELLDLVSLGREHATRRPAELSGGQRQRVALARALAADPRVIIADEITSALDVSVQGSVLNLIRGIVRDSGTSMLFISHNLAVVRYVSDIIAVMYQGEIVEIAPADELIAHPQVPYTRALLSAVPRMGERLPRSSGGGSA